MPLNSWLRSRLGKGGSARKGGKTRRLQIEQLEERVLLSNGLGDLLATRAGHILIPAVMTPPGTVVGHEPGGPGSGLHAAAGKKPGASPFSKGVRNLFRALLHRQPTSGELNRSTHALQAGGCALALEAQLLGGAEYFRTRGHRKLPTFLAALGHDVLGHPFDAGTQAQLTGLLHQGVSRTALAALVLTGTDAQQALLQGSAQHFLNGLLPLTPASVQQCVAVLIAQFIAPNPLLAPLRPPPTPRDTQPPVLTILSPTAAPTTNQELTVTGLVTDNLDAVTALQARVDGAAPVAVPFDAAGHFSFTTALPRNGSVDGPHTVQLSATDQAGNVGSTSVAFTLDTTGPAIRLTSPAPNLATNTNVTVAGQAMDALSGVASLQEQLDGGAFAPVTVDTTGHFSFTTGLPLNGSADGHHTVQLRATDTVGNASTTSVAFTLATVAPTLTLVAPATGATVNTTAHLVGSVAAVAGPGTAQFALDGGAFAPLTLNAAGAFDQALAATPLAAGSHQVVVKAADAAGNTTQQTVSFSVATSGFVIGPTGSGGWAQTTADSVTLGEEDSFLVQAALPVQLGQSQGTRTLAFQVAPQFDTTDQSTVSADRLLVYLASNPAKPTQTLLTGDQPGTPLFALTKGGTAEFPAGLVRFDGTTVQVDVSSLTASATDFLVFQLLGGDSDAGSVIDVSHLTDTADPQGVDGPMFNASAPTVAAAGPALDLSKLTTTTAVQVQLGDVRLDPGSGQYTALLTVQNNGPDLGRTLAVVFPGLPSGVQLSGASGSDASGNPYLNLAGAIQPGGLAAGTASEPVQVTFADPKLLRFFVKPTVLTGGPDVGPTLARVGPLTVMPGHRLAVPLQASDPDGDPIAFSLQSSGPMPTSTLQSDGTLVFTPTPSDVGSYEFTVVASDGHLQATQPVSLTVSADPQTTTRISGVIEDTSNHPLAGIPIAVGNDTTTTATDGSFLLDFGTNPPPADRLQVHGEQANIPTTVFPFIAEKLELLLGHDVFSGVNNVISRPIFLPPLDVADGQQINPNQDQTITTAAIPGASVFVKAGTLDNQQGQPFTGVLSITQVPTNLTPAALPADLHPDLVVTIQPGQMKFLQPAPLSLPNLSGYAAGTQLNLWSINPTTGFFDNVGVGQVSNDGKVINTISGGIHNSSWHFFAPITTSPNPAVDNPANGNGGSGCGSGCSCSCGTGGASGNTISGTPGEVGPTGATLAVASDVELHSGAVLESHNLVTYQSLGVSRGLTLTYDSMTADPRPIEHFGFNEVQSDSAVRLVAALTLSRGNFSFQVPGAPAGAFGLAGGENVWAIPQFPPNPTFQNRPVGNLDASEQIDMANMPSGVYHLQIQEGLRRFNGQLLTGSDVNDSDTIASVNDTASPFGSGWGIAGLQQIVTNPDGSALLIDGSGGSLMFGAPATAGQPFVDPAGDFSTLVQRPDGTFQRTLPDQTVYSFNAAGLLATVTARNGNTTTYTYDGNGNLTRITDPVGLKTTFTNTSGKVTAITDPAGRVTTLAYDATGNLIRITDPDGTHVDYQYDAGHHLTVATDQRGNSARHVFDSSGRVTEVIRPDGSVVRVQPPETHGLLPASATADAAAPPAAAVAAGGTTTYTDGNGNVTAANLDRFGRAVTATDGAGALPTAVVNTQDLVTRSIDARGNSTVYTHDAKGNVTSVSDPTSGQPTLFPGQLVVTGNNPHAVAVGDLNGDGIPDMVVADNANFFGSVQVYLGKGDGTFGPPKEIDIQAGAEAVFDVVLADLTGDGKLDIVTCNRSGMVAVLPGHGDGTFGPEQDIATGLASPESLAAGALDGDSDLDLVVGDGNAYNHTGKSVAVLLNKGDGTFGTPQIFATDAGVTSVALGDLTGNGKLDIVTANTAGTVSVLLGNGDGTFGTHQDIALAEAGTSVALADVTGDGKQDIVVGEQSMVAVLPGHGDGTFGPRLDLKLGGCCHGVHVAAGDLNGDGHTDIVAVQADQQAADVLLSDGKGGFAPHQDFPVGSFPGAVLLADLTGNGRLDAVVANTQGSSVSVLLGQGNGTFAVPAPDVAGPPAAQTQSVALGDLTGNGKVDMVVTSATGFVSVYMGNGDGTFGKPTNFTVGPDPSVVVLADFQHNGHLDVLTGNSDETLSLLLGNGDGTFQPARTINLVSTGAAVVSLAVGDLEGNGDLDIVAGTAGGYLHGISIQVLLGHGDGTFGPANVVDQNDLDPGSLSIGDVTGDGKPDLVVSGRATSLMRGNGDGTFQAPTPVTFTVGFTSPFASTVADLNGDGKLDLVALVDAGTPEVLVQLGNGDGTFGPTTVLPLLDTENDSSQSLAVTDVNGDGIPDIVVLQRNIDTVSVFLGRGAGTFDPRQDFHFGGSTAGANFPTSLAVGDLNGDGFADLVATDQNTDHVSVLLNGSGSQGFTYDPKFNQLTSETDEVGRKTLYQIDPANGNTLSETQVVPGGTNVLTAFTYNAQGQMLTETDPLGRVTRYAYDSLGRLITLTEAAGTPDQGVLHYTYDAAGNVIVTTDEDGNTTQYQYDAMNRLVKTTQPDPDGTGPLTPPVTTYTYDADGNQVAITDAAGNTTRYTFDALNRLVQTTDAAGGVTTYQYDMAGNQTAVADPLGHTTRSVYDARGRLTEQIDPTGAVTHYQYDADDDLTALTDPDGNVTRYAYDARGQQVKMVDPLGHVAVTLYNGAGDVVQTTDRDGRTILTAYDALDRLTTETWVGGGNVIHYGYDAADNLTSLTDAFSSLAFTYDNRDRVTSVDNAGAPGAPHVVLNYTYDATGNRLSMAETINGQAGATTAYAYDALDEMTQITQSGGGAHDKRVDLAYNEVGGFTAINRFADLAGTQLVAGSTYTYDSLNQLTNLTYANSHGTVASYALQYDAASRLTQVKDSDGITNYTYDAADRLLSSTSTDPALPAEAYSYDANGNRTSSAQSAGAIVTGPDNQLQSDGTFTYQYDGEGNLVKRTTVATGAVRTFQYDFHGRLTSVTDTDAKGNVTQQVVYTYNALGQRIAETVTDGNVQTQTDFVYDGDNVLLDFVATGSPGSLPPATLAERYLDGPAVDQVFAQDDGRGHVLWLLTDWEGATRDLADDTGAVVNHITYDSFGNVLSQTNPAASSRYLYAGREFDPATGLYYDRARFYNPATGGFLSEDPLGPTGSSTNLYAYGLSDPTNNTDPSGLDAGGELTEEQADRLAEQSLKQLDEHFAKASCEAQGQWFVLKPIMVRQYNAEKLVNGTKEALQNLRQNAQEARTNPVGLLARKLKEKRDLERELNGEKPCPTATPTATPMPSARTPSAPSGVGFWENVKGFFRFLYRLIFGLPQTPTGPSILSGPDKRPPHVG
jgi:RHS repeat-associated protein